MAISRAIYHRTGAGHEALQRLDCALPEHYRQTLEAVHHITPFDEVAAALRQYSALQIGDWLEDFEAIGLVESVEAEWLEEFAAAADYTPEPVTTV
jgi:hypothetical protein